MIHHNERIRSVIYLVIILCCVMVGCRKQEQPEDHSPPPPIRETGYFLLDEFLALDEDENIRYENFRQMVQAPGEPVETGKQERQVRIAMVYPGAEKSDYWTRSVSSFSARMEELNIENEVLEFFSRPGSVDSEIQEAQINEALQEDPDYLVFTLAVSRHKELIERIITIGRPKLILQNITTPLKEWMGNQPFLYVGFSHKLGTEKTLVPEFLRRVGTEGSYAMLYFARGFVSEQRGDTFIRYMEEHTNLKLKTAFYTDGQYDKARDATNNILDEYPDVDFIYACSTNIALAAVEVLEERGVKDKILVNGWGGGSSELESIVDGHLDFTVMRMNDDNGIAMAEAIKLDIIGEDHKIPTVYSGDFVLVNQDTSLSELEDLKKRAFRYSGYYE